MSANSESPIPESTKSGFSAQGLKGLNSAEQTSGSDPAPVQLSARTGASLAHQINIEANTLFTGIGEVTPGAPVGTSRNEQLALPGLDVSTLLLNQFAATVNDNEAVLAQREAYLSATI